ncbi:MAG: Lrp/AsnC family transcriptional regulator [Candidatus Syntrophoarchaeum sp. WYZ-LMO15]|nr:MAG: Lrp/AsnC family transcriptional regulator [Candidatus Syntrophoarchaeum sp. WYZ-LMO15]
MKGDIDELDRQVLQKMLEGKGVGARLTQLANELGIPRSTANLRVTKLEERGVISRYVPRIDWKKLGYEFFGFIGIACPTNALNTLITRLKDEEIVSDIWDVTTGTFRILLQCRFRSYEDLRRLYDLIMEVPGIRDVEVWLLGKSYKDES